MKGEGLSFATVSRPLTPPLPQNWEEARSVHMEPELLENSMSQEPTQISCPDLDIFIYVHYKYAPWTYLNMKPQGVERA